MCGIVGMASHTGQAARDALIGGRDAMAHRGPDDCGAWWSADGRVGLGHRRLSIVDLTPGGHQPMHDGTGRLTIVFNGEIYNFRELRRELQSCGHSFRSRSDTEVILAAYARWGVDCVSRFNGMFAFCIFDAAHGKLFMARDRAGEKPLFYALRGGEIRFASEIKGLLADPGFPRSVAPESLDTYLALGYVPGERCILRNVAKLPPAHALQFDIDSGSHRVWRYWELPAPPPHGVSEADAGHLLAELEGLLEDAVRHQLEADVPVGVLLSGGVDSSLVTAMAVRGARNLKTFTVIFPGSAHDESRHARLVAAHFNTQHVELAASAILPDMLPALAHQFDEPVADSSMIPTHLVSELVRRHCTVALGGDGGDELFGGYAHYDRLLWTQEMARRVPVWLRKLSASAAGRLLPTGFRGRNWLRSLGCDLENELALIASFFDPAERRRLMATQEHWSVSAEEMWRQRVPSVSDLLQRATRMEFLNYMPDDILVKVDRASMLHSLEVRAPLLDHRLIEFAFGQVPSALKTTRRERKVLLKRLAARLLPPEFDRRRKQGFSIPLAQWLRSGPWREFFRDVLNDAQCIFDKRETLRLFKGQDAGRYNQERLFALVLFELWRRDYRLSL